MCVCVSVCGGEGVEGNRAGGIVKHAGSRRQQRNQVVDTNVDRLGKGRKKEK